MQSFERSGLQRTTASARSDHHESDRSGTLPNAKTHKNSCIFKELRHFERSPGFQLPLERSPQTGKSDNDRFARHGTEIPTQAYHFWLHGISRPQIKKHHMVRIVMNHAVQQRHKFSVPLTR